MKKLITILTTILLLSQIVFSQTLSNNTSVRSCMFIHPEQGNYIEVYFVIGANAIKYLPVKPRGFQGGVEIEIMIGEATNVVNYNKYKLNTPVVYDTNTIDFSIMDQQRLFVPNKTLSVEIKIMDINDSTNSFTSTDAFIPFLNDAVQISDIQFIDTFKQTSEKNNFTKNGFEFQPYPINFFPSNKNAINIYGEIYHTDKYLNDGQFLVTYSIRNSSTDEVNQQFYQYTKFDAQPVVPFFQVINITDLPSGNYNLYVEVRNKKNELITQKKVFIQRAKTGPVNAWENIEMINTSGTFVDDYSEEQLNQYLDELKPIASQNEVKLIESLSPRVEADMKKKFLYNFWVERNSVDPYKEWIKYLKLVDEANESFSTPSKLGYKTDRGRVYLQYGHPYDVVTSVNEPGAYPYEIWFYTILPDKQTNIGFAFYEPTMVTNDYILIHSNARGELHDQRWKVKLYENVASPQELFDIDNTKVSDKTGGYRAVDSYDF